MLGVDALLRCAPGQRAGAAKICLRARDLVVLPAGRQGARATVERLIYQGGYFRMEARPLEQGDQLIHLDAPEPVAAKVGDEITLGVADGWVIPGAAA